MVQCYYKNDANPSLIRSINSGVCLGSGSSAGFYSCCFPWDTCLPNGFCATNTTYYSALCTDQTLQDSSCQKGCGGLYRTGLQYDTAASVWKCCNQEDRTCSTGTNATFNAPAPEQLRVQTRSIVDFIPTSTVPSNSASRTSVSSSTTALTSAPAAAVSNSEKSSGLSTGVKAGIGIGVALAVIALIAGLAFWLMKRRRDRERVTPVPPFSSYPAQPQATEMPHSGRVTQAPVYEKAAPAWTAEADSSTSGSVYNKTQQQRIHELG